ncbi:MAG: glycosyltransferase family 1 protein [Aureispira sp.]|nr:glycosyltransferase family 1 protein [Aureispira sp.]
MRTLRIAILGTRGIPNRYGGFEQFAEYLSQGLVQRGHEVYVYNSSLHPYTESTWNGVNILQKKDPENKLGTFGQFLYDLNCIRDARKRDFDISLQLGYGSSSIWSRLWPKNSINITNMDGLEWARTKYSAKVQYFLKKAEGWAVKASDYLIADSVAIADYLLEVYNTPSAFIPYGAKVLENPDFSKLDIPNLEPFNYHILVARLEPENNIEIAIQGVLASDRQPLLIVGSYENSYGQMLYQKYNQSPKIHFLGSIYDLDILNNLRYYSLLYFHGHSVGGTNPSLLEAMASHALICAHNNAFNKTILENDAFYFETVEDIKTCINSVQNKLAHAALTQNNIKKIRQQYNWEQIIDQYEQLFLSCITKSEAVSK